MIICVRVLYIKIKGERGIDAIYEIAAGGE